MVDLVSIVTNKDFYPRSPCGERLIVKIRGSVRPDISIHALLAESDTRHGSCRRRLSISIHALLAESDGGVRSSCFGRIIFLSTLSLRRATSNGGNHYSYIRISIHALLAESDQLPKIGKCACAISIHALLAESDDRQRKRHPHPLDFYPRSPCGERHVPLTVPDLGKGFLSTLSLRRATTSTDHHPTSILISIHALLAESDAEMVSRSSISCQFLSTLSLRRATAFGQSESPHA